MNDKVLSLDLDDPDQLSEKESGPVECLGKTFENDQARRDYYLAILAEKLKDPEFRKIEGFPIGEDEDILNLSDPPYYTACPNPFLEDFIRFYGRPYDPSEEYKREPYTNDISEGKNDPIYNAHSYHTKVPYKAIIRYILHYTNPGDLVLDGFCGTGMTGVAAQMCGDRETIVSLGYQVKSDNTILEENTDLNGNKIWQPISKLGVRRAILNDLSPAATFITHNYNKKIDISEFEAEAKKILEEVDNECGWMYETLHIDGKTKGKINYTVWSDVFICPECSGEIVFWNEAVDKKEKKVKDSFLCPHCSLKLSKAIITRLWETSYDTKNDKFIKQAKQVPVLLRYTVDGKRFEKTLDENDYLLIEKIEEEPINYWYPNQKMPIGLNTKQPEVSHGYSNVHHFFTKRNLIALACLYSKTKGTHKLVFQSIVATLCSKLVRYNMGNRGNGILNGTLYMPSLSAEAEIIKVAKGKVNDFAKAFIVKSKNITQCSSFGNTLIPNDSLDYIFIDPPFGANINYSELNFIWEAWLKVLTNNMTEAIENIAQGKDLNDYRQLMSGCFKEAYRVLKPGRWMTVEFSNTKSTVWNSIQSALSDAGFIISNVSALDKKQGSFKAVTTTTAVKQDLVISAYKPKQNLDEAFVSTSNNDGVWDFIRSHLGYLPIIKRAGNELIKVPERDPRILFDQVVAYFVRHMRDVPLSSKEFQHGLIERFSERDGMIFLPEQVAQYDKARMSSTKLRQLSIFVHDESSAIDWLRQLLMDKPQTYQDIQPKFMSELSGWKKAEIQLELIKLLEQNFLKFNGQGLVPAQIHSYLSTNFKELRGLEKDDPELLAKAKDRWFVPDPNNEEQLQALRERDLLKQFEEYKTFSGKKIKQVRMEAVRAGFKKAWKDRDYETIIHIAEKIPESLLQEDEKLLMWYDQAQTRHGNTGFF